jgi:diguanylate cyclase (GGDEF)-like protein
MELTRDHLQLLATFAELASVAYGNASAHASLGAQARTDGLTGCLNHAALQTALTDEIERSRRSGHTCAVALLDLDDFKGVNESHGHLVGDEVLRRVGAALRQAVRPFDIAARYGGDEFAIVAADVDEEAMAEIAGRAVSRITSGLRGVIGGTHRVVTAGVAEWNPSLDASGLLDLADGALMHGKRGPDGVVRASLLPAGLPQRNHRPAPLSADESAAVDQPALALEQTQRLRKRTRQLGLASALGARLAAMNDVDDICNAAVDELNRAFGYHLCAVIEIRDDGYVHARSVRGDHFERLGDRRWRQPRAAGVIGRCLRERRTIVVNDVYAEASYVATDETADVRSELVSPLWVGDQLWGAVNLEAIDRDAFDEDDARLIQTVTDQIGSALRSAMLYEQLDRAYLGTAEALAAALEAKDSYTAQHARSILEHADSVGHLLGLDDVERRVLRFAAIFHDIGKIAVPEMILNKRGPLNEDEWRVVKRHTVVGEQILAPVEFLAAVRPLVRHEHERWDGAGYPDGLTGEQIPLGSRIILACDAYHAMTSDRPYRQAMPDGTARGELEANAGTQFDPAVVDALLEVLDTRAVAVAG